MAERRQAFRRDPIEVDLGDDKVISVGPVPWQQRNDFGDAVIRQNIQVINEAVSMYVDPDTSAPQLEAKLGQKFNDANELLILGLDEATYELVMAISPLYYNQIIAILVAAAEVNELDQLLPLIDPKLLAPTTLGGLVSDLMMERMGDTPKTESSPSSSSQDSNGAISNDSLTEKSPAS
jgi:hypothetical protein